MSITVTVQMTPARRARMAQAAEARKQTVQPQQAAPAARSVPIAVPVQQQSRTVVRPRFMGDSFAYIPEQVSTVNADGTPKQSPVEAFLDWLFGTKSR